MHSSAMEMAQQWFTSILIIFVAGTAVSRLAQKLRIPDVVLFILTGMIIGPSALDYVNIPNSSTFNQAILLFGASFILFHGGTITKFVVLKRVWISITLLSTLGVIITALVVAIGAHFILDLPFMTSLLLGAILASTDPAALVPIFQRFPIRAKVAQTVIAESAFTDATGSIFAIVIFSIVVSSVGTSGWSVFGQFIYLAAGGIIVGVVVGGVSAFLISENDWGLLREFTPMVIVICVLAGYVIAEAIHSSGFMSVFVAGLMVGNARALRLRILPREELSMHHFVDALGLKFRMLIFVLLGSQVNLSLLRDHGLQAFFISLIFMFIARPLTVLACLLPDRRAKWTKNELVFFFWTRETGVIAAALIGIVSSVVSSGQLLLSITFVAILMTLLIQASTTPLVAKILGLIDSPQSSSSK